MLAAIRGKIVDQLQSISDTARQDAELLLMKALNKSREALLSDSRYVLTSEEVAVLEALVTRRLKGEPIAYILGHQPFWTLDLTVTADTLIPRPETECLIDWILTHHKETAELTAADLGTGSGAIAITLATEKPHWHIDAVDLSYEALAIARQNAKNNQCAQVAFYQGNWCEALPDKQYDLIISNPPYIAENDLHLEQLSFEPVTALVSGHDGLKDIRLIAVQAKTFLKKEGILVIEHGYDQGEAVFEILENAGYHNIQNHRDLADIPRFVTAVN